ncbi:hypothetical protein MPNT_200018 [Candidatus Methylacidithermus pantelleriae]|uniref:Uncharacterized protein n=1 Tax=Candidatus Methylacidithermus pantelleriae TaxID=2744239 RepID=A0A8J2BJD5_9BACT|nr:hypothetical protein MPNT_200018 [Candidatus Methylacidithermus pantelleriae]
MLSAQEIDTKGTALSFDPSSTREPVLSSNRDLSPNHLPTREILFPSGDLKISPIFVSSCF